MYRVLDGGIEVFEEGGEALVRLLVGDRRSVADDLLHLRLELHECGLTADTGVATLQTALAGWLTGLSESYRGWQGTRSWESIERDARIDAVHDGRGHVTLRFVVRGPRGYESDAWERSASLSPLAKTCATWPAR